SGSSFVRSMVLLPQKRVRVPQNALAFNPVDRSVCQVGGCLQSGQDIGTTLFDIIWRLADKELYKF
ncbi:MAG: hypothetical protein AAGA73_05665, partial [Pseudomonadota bacterium]